MGRKGGILVEEEGVFGQEFGRKANRTYLTNLTTSPGDGETLYLFVVLFFEWLFDLLSSNITHDRQDSGLIRSTGMWD